jgi:CRP-like cAMP-binding protein
MLCDWPADVLHALVASARLERYDRRTSIERQRREAMVVVSGRVEWEVVDPAGTRFVLHMAGPGELICLLRMLDVPHFVYDCLVHEGAVVVHLPIGVFRAVLDSHPLLWRDLCLPMMQRLHGLIVRQQRRALGQIDSQVADLLAELAQTQGRVGDDGLLNLRMSQSDLAAC